VQRVAVEDVRVLTELKGKGVTLTTWDAEELRKVRALAQQVWADWSKKSPLAKRGYDAQTAWLRELGVLA
jgi:TRAP-type mannitol/chloroaromatic compound transport system substrate-binding protein